MSAKVTEWVWDYFTGTPEEKIVLLSLARQATDSGVIAYWGWQDTQDITLKTGVKYDVLKKLEQDGVITQEKDSLDYVLKPYKDYLAQQYETELMRTLVEDRIAHLRDTGRLSSDLYEYIMNKDIFHDAP